MYYNEYDEYMQGILGYPNTNENTFERNYTYEINPVNTFNQMPIYQNRNQSNDIEKMYPEIYKLINPLVCRMCDNNTQPISEYLVEQMTDDIYDNVVNRVEIQNVINLNIGTREMDSEHEVTEENCTRDINSTDSLKTSNQPNLSRTSPQMNRTSNCSQNISKNNAICSNQDDSNYRKICDNDSLKGIGDSKESRSPHFRRNRLLRDLIRILILNRFTRPERPVRPGRPGPRPPYRPPFRPGYQPPYNNTYIPYM